jgi:hypothetical protein
VAVLAILFRGMQILLDLVVAGIGAGIMKREFRTQNSELRIGPSPRPSPGVPGEGRSCGRA